jgi:tetratricopeptide (TPR) repeat protein
VLIWLGDAHAGRKDFAAALENYRRAVSLLETSDERSLDDDSRCELATGLNRVGEILVRMDRLDEASTAFQRARGMADSDRSRQRHDVPALYVAAEALAGIGDVSAKQARASVSKSDQAQRRLDARQAYAQSLRDWKDIPSPARITPLGIEAPALDDLPMRLAQIESR